MPAPAALVHWGVRATGRSLGMRAMGWAKPDGSAAERQHQPLHASSVRGGHGTSPPRTPAAWLPPAPLSLVTPPPLPLLLLHPFRCRCCRWW